VKKNVKTQNPSIFYKEKGKKKKKRRETPNGLLFVVRKKISISSLPSLCELKALVHPF